jgi:hypothetical protein
MSFFSFPVSNIFGFGSDALSRYEMRHERKISYDSRNGALLEPLESSLFRLQDIRVRMSTRISKEIASGTDMSVPIGLLGPADQALSYAAEQVADATSTLDAANPHPAYQQSQAAYFALDQARQDLETVLQSIETAIAEHASSTATTAAASTQ